MMHTPLHPHLHTEECNKIIKKLLDCHADTYKVQQLFGICNDLDVQMRKCTKNERLGKVQDAVDAANQKKKEQQALGYPNPSLKEWYFGSEEKSKK